LAQKKSQTHKCTEKIPKDGVNSGYFSEGEWIGEILPIMYEIVTKRMY
jgi:hypothetical protein